MASPHVAGAAALYIAQNGKSMNAAGVAAIRQALINAAQPQTAWGPSNTNDPDANQEGLLLTVPTVLVLQNQTINTMQIYGVADSITAGPSFAIVSPGDVTFRAGNVIRLVAGFTAKSGSRFHTAIAAAPASPTLIEKIVQPEVTDLPSSEKPDAIPEQTELLANYPNPFNPETWIPYRLAKDAFVTLTIYNTRGTVVRTIQVGHQPAAVYESRDKAIYWDGRNNSGERVASGIYFYRFTAGDYTATRKMVILK
jgi:hypothetical protein